MSTRGKSRTDHKIDTFCPSSGRDCLFRTIFNTLQDGVLVADIASMRLQHANPTICRMLGYTQDELLALNVADIHPPDSLPHVRDSFQRQARGELPLAKDIPILRKDQTVFMADIAACSMVLDGQAVLLGAFREATERIAVETELAKHRQNLQHLVDERTAELRKLVMTMAGRETRMAELKEVIRKLRRQLLDEGLSPASDDPLAT